MQPALWAAAGIVPADLCKRIAGIRFQRSVKGARGSAALRGGLGGITLGEILQHLPGDKAHSAARALPCLPRAVVSWRNTEGIS